MNRPAPLTRGGRQTLVYLCLAGSGPVLTAIIIWALVTIRDWVGVDPTVKLTRFSALTFYIAVSLLIIVISLAAFVSIRAIKIGKDGIEAESNGNGEEPPAVTTVTATATVTAPPGSTVDAGPPNS